MSKDITGYHFGYWTVLGRDTEYKSSKKSKWICQCECGSIHSVFKESLLSGRSKSCGCHAFDNRKGLNSTHGLSSSRIYHEWLSMRRRCSNSANPNYKTYLNINVCDEWQHSFDSFYQWAINNGYSDNLTIDRIDNNLGYSPCNCRWITIEEQQSNKTNTIRILYNGEYYCLRSLCRLLNFPYKTAHRRYHKMVQKGHGIDTSKLFEPIHEDKISFRYRV